MHSLKCRHAGAFLDALPVSPHLQLSDVDFISGCQFRLGATGTHPHIPAVACYCRRHVQGRDTDHSMSCNRLSRGRTIRHDHYKATLSRLSHRAGRSSQLEPAFNGYGHANLNKKRARADVRAFLPPPNGISLLDISNTHPRCATCVHLAAQQPGATAARRDRDKYRGKEGHALRARPLSLRWLRPMAILASPLCSSFHSSVKLQHSGPWDSARARSWPVHTKNSALHSYAVRVKCTMHVPSCWPRRLVVSLLKELKLLTLIRFLLGFGCD
jgi:hypothetical protein